MTEFILDRVVYPLFITVIIICHLAVALAIFAYLT